MSSDKSSRRPAGVGYVSGSASSNSGSTRGRKTKCSSHSVPALSEETVSENRSRFVIEPLEPGFGYTLGNSLRRTLLSSIPGAAVTSIKIDGNLHEFSTIEGVVEDVTEVILNLKGLVVSSEEDEPVTMYLRKAGPARSPRPTSPRRRASRCTTPSCTSPP